MDEYNAAYEQELENQMILLSHKDYSGIKAIEEEVGVSADEFINNFESEVSTSNFWERVKAATNNALKKTVRWGNDRQQDNERLNSTI